jgi:hypothetical protein
MTDKATICAYCRKEIEGAPVQESIGFRTRDPYTRKAVYKTEIRQFCSDQCACYEQFAMEG